eukprot:scaffold7631_cov376-Prasinococcus_capsulatus_cf.AAC.2
MSSVCTPLRGLAFVSSLKARFLRAQPRCSRYCGLPDPLQTHVSVASSDTETAVKHYEKCRLMYGLQLRRLRTYEDAQESTVPARKIENARGAVEQHKRPFEEAQERACRKLEMVEAKRFVDISTHLVRKGLTQHASCGAA